ncbi:MAG: FkbM family methyltransferase, partial [Lachnospiraceae bacterium]|nr:FkbM family methyltransferase [Lachnospiraceae bacterium]
NQYFFKKEFKFRNAREIFVDCGAYVGDTVEQYLGIKEGVFNEIYAFEPDPGNVIALSKRIERLRNEWNIADSRIHIIEGAVGKENSTCFINNDIGGLGAKITDTATGNKTKIYGLDTFLEDVPVGFLKADIEGYELDMLLGTAEIIRKHRPLLAVCVYHQSADLYKIPLLLKKLNCDYRLDIAHHYYNYTETVLYAY